MCRLELENFRGACGPLTHVLKGWPTHPANAAAWRALVQAALAAGKKEVASEGLQGWLQSASGSADAALSLGAGGRVNTSHLEQELAVRHRTIFHCYSKTVGPFTRATASSLWHLSLARLIFSMFFVHYSHVHTIFHHWCQERCGPWVMALHWPTGMLFLPDGHPLMLLYTSHMCCRSACWNLNAIRPCFGLVVKSRSL